MAANPENDLSFSTSDGIIYDPLKIVSEISADGFQLIHITNMNVDFSLKGLGLYIRPSSNLGPLDYPAEAPPATDYQDILMWGSRSVREPLFEGGVRVTMPSSADTSIWVSRSKGSTWSNKIPIDTLAPGESLTFKIEFVVPQVSGVSTSLDARRFFVSVVVG